jgi:hypothetical protein
LSALASAAPTGLQGSQRPGLLHLPDGSDAYVEDALYLLGEWDFGYDEAQRFVMASALREQPDGRWAAKEVGVEEPRQNGKGEILEGRECLGLFYLDERKLIHSAHEFATASEALDRMEDRIGQNTRLKQRTKTVKRSHGEEGVYLKDGRSLRYKTRTKGGGRGFSADLLILDEAMYIAEAFLGALMPVISARPNPQMWYTGSAVDQNTMEHGVVFSRLRQRALALQASNQRERGRMAYFGWSAAYEDNRVLWERPTDVPRSVAKDPAAVARANPALGIRIELEHVLETEFPAMGHETYLVERLGVGDWPRVDEEQDGSVISAKTWLSLADTNSEPADPVWFAFDVAEDRTSASISVAARRDDGLFHVEVIDQKRGTEWVVARLVELEDKHQPEAILYDATGPAASLEKQIENVDLAAVTPVNSTEHAQACGSFFDAVDQRKLRHLGTAEMVSAIKGAVKRQSRDAWTWNRKDSTVDISPLVACTLALWGSVEEVGSGQSVWVFG